MQEKAKAYEKGVIYMIKLPELSRILTILVSSNIVEGKAREYK